MILLLKLLHKQKIPTLITIFISVSTAAVTLWWNAQLGSIINMVSEGVTPSKDIIFRALITMLVMGGTNYAKGYIAGYTCESLTHDLRMGYALYFTSLPVAETEKLNAGEQLSRLQNEIADVSDYLNTSLFQLWDDGVRFLLTFSWLFFISPMLTMASNLPAFIILLYVFWSSKIIGPAVERSQKAKGQMNQYADILLTLFPVIRLYDAARLTLDGYVNAIGVWKKQTILMERTKAWLMSLSGVLSSIPLLFLFLVGGHMTIRGVLTIGTLYVFVNLSGNVSGVLMNMPGHITAFRQFSSNINKMRSLTKVSEDAT